MLGTRTGRSGRLNISNPSSEIERVRVEVDAEVQKDARPHSLSVVREAIPGSYEVSALHNRWTSKTAPNRFKIRGEAKLVVLLGTAAVHHDHRHADMVYRARTSGGT